MDIGKIIRTIEVVPEPKPQPQHVPHEPNPAKREHEAPAEPTPALVP